MKALLLINGKPPKHLPELEQYDKVYCTDGAYLHFAKKNIIPDYVIGDFDSVKETEIPSSVQVLKRMDQDFTDFHKCLEVILSHGLKNVDVYGSTGSEHDHFLGNLTTAHHFKDKLAITFLDDYSTFFFAKKEVVLKDVKDRIISLYPFPTATKVRSQGLFYPLNEMDLSITQKIGTRNHATEEEVKITYASGDLMIFVSKYRLSDKELDYKDKINQIK